MLSQSALRSVWSPRCRGPWVVVPANGAGRWVVRPSAAEAFRALATVQRAFGYSTRAADTGAYVCRASVSGAGASLHAYGIAGDSNWQSNPYGQTRRTDRPEAMNRAIVAIRTNDGAQVFNWGGYWRGNKDPMHDEIVCSPRNLASGINWSTVAGHTAAPKPQSATTPRPSTPAPQEEDDVEYLRDDKSGAIYSFDGNTYLHLSGPAWQARQEEARDQGRTIQAKSVNGLVILHRASSRKPA